MVKKILILFSIIIFSNNIYSQKVSISATTDSTNYKIGDYINYSVKVVRNKNIKINMPSVKDSIKILDFIKDLGKETKEIDNKIVDTYKYIFSKYDSAEVIIPSYKINYSTIGSNKIETATVNDVYISVIPIEVNTKGDILDVKVPVKIPFNILWALLIVAIIILFLVIIYFVYNFYRKKKKSGRNIEQKIYIPPHKIALKSLSELEEKELWQKGEVKKYHSDITEIIRKYFEGEFFIKALEMPTSELLDEMGKISKAKNIKNISEDFFYNADMVKFAKFKPMPSINELMLKQAYQIVETTYHRDEKENTNKENTEVTNVK